MRQHDMVTLYTTMATSDCFQALVSGGACCEAAVSALGGCISHLRTVLLDRWVQPVLHFQCYNKLSLAT